LIATAGDSCLKGPEQSGAFPLLLFGSPLTNWSWGRAAVMPSEENAMAAEYGCDSAEERPLSMSDALVFPLRNRLIVASLPHKGIRCGQSGWPQASKSLPLLLLRSMQFLP
jgi:hypothetical protein